MDDEKEIENEKEQPDIKSELEETQEELVRKKKRHCDSGYDDMWGEKMEMAFLQQGIGWYDVQALPETQKKIAKNQRMESLLLKLQKLQEKAIREDDYDRADKFRKKLVELKRERSTLKVGLPSRHPAVSRFLEKLNDQTQLALQQVYSNCGSNNKDIEHSQKIEKEVTCSGQEKTQGSIFRRDRLIQEKQQLQKEIQDLRRKLAELEVKEYQLSMEIKEGDRLILSQDSEVPSLLNTPLGELQDMYKALDEMGNSVHRNYLFTEIPHHIKSLKERELSLSTTIKEATAKVFMCQKLCSSLRKKVSDIETQLPTLNEAKMVSISGSAAAAVASRGSAAAAVASRGSAAAAVASRGSAAAAVASRGSAAAAVASRGSAAAAVASRGSAAAAVASRGSAAAAVASRGSAAAAVASRGSAAAAVASRGSAAAAVASRGSAAAAVASRGSAAAAVASRGSAAAAVASRGSAAAAVASRGSAAAAVASRGSAAAAVASRGSAAAAVASRGSAAAAVASRGSADAAVASRGSAATAVTWSLRGSCFTGVARDPASPGVTTLWPEPHGGELPAMKNWGVPDLPPWPPPWTLCFPVFRD
ncbi:UNVERIFIED_CONTAM: hypothetical protein FKN15_020264 [Acipenser sinensis]